MTATHASTSTERVRRFRQRAKQEGWAIVAVKVPASKVEDLRAYADSLGEPARKQNPEQGYLFPDLFPEA